MICVNSFLLLSYKTHSLACNFRACLQLRQCHVLDATKALAVTPFPEKPRLEFTIIDFISQILSKLQFVGGQWKPAQFTAY
jgi:hypothetical protein